MMLGDDEVRDAWVGLVMGLILVAVVLTACLLSGYCREPDQVLPPPGEHSVLLEMEVL